MSMMLDKAEDEAQRICMIKLKIKSPQIHFMSALVILHSAFWCSLALGHSFQKPSSA